MIKTQNPAKSIPTLFNLPPHVKARLKALATANGLNATAYVIKLIMDQK